MLSETSSNDSALSDACSLPAPQNTPSVTSNAVIDVEQMSVVRQLYPSTTIDSHGQQSSTEHKVPQKSHAVVRDQGTSCTSSSSHKKITSKGANFSRPTTETGKGQQNTASVTERMTSAHKVILPAAASRNLHSDVATTSSKDDVREKLRALILSGSRKQQPQNGNSMCFYGCNVCERTVCF